MKTFERRTVNDAQRGVALDPDHGGGHPQRDSQTAPAAVVVDDLPAARHPATPGVRPRQDQGHGDGRCARDAQPEPAVAVADDLPAAMPASAPEEAARQDSDGIGGGPPVRDAQRGPAAADPSIPLRLAADTLNDVETLRKAMANRIRALGEMKAWSASPPALRWQGHLRDLEALEHQVELEMVRALREHPLGPWVRGTVGVGEKQGARLIGALGDPAWNSAENRPRRGPAELWAYCGYAPDQKRRKGETSNWNADAKMRAYLVAARCVMNDGKPDKNGRPRALSPYRPVYDAARASWADRDTSDAHKHQHALRLVAKAILRDLWKEATRLREQT